MSKTNDFHIPDEILSLIPTDPYDQLDLARKITSLAIASRVSKLELTVAEKDRRIEELETKVSQLESLFHDSDSRLRVSLEENAKLVKERDTLAVTAKKLARDLAKLETFKRHLMQSISEDNSSQAESVDISTYEQTGPKLPSWKDRTSFSLSSSNPTSSIESADSVRDASRGSSQKISPYISPRITPTSNTPRNNSTGGTPNMTSGVTSPTKTTTQNYISMSPWFPSSQRSSAANSPTRARSLPGRTPRIDGKEFFRQARNRLSYEQFGAFLANIKELNAHRQSREETLRKAEEIFGKDNKDLYLSFQGLLSGKPH